MTARGRTFMVWFVGPFIERAAREAGLRGRDLESACFSEAATIREFIEVFDLAPKWARGPR